MGLVNRDKDASEQLHALGAVQNLTVGASAASTFHVCQMPYPATLKAVSIAANSISGAPVVSVGVKRFTSGGVTSIGYVGSTMAVVATGISAYAGQLVGVTSFSLQAGDVIYVQAEFAGGNVAAANSAISVIVKATQDITSWFGLTS